MKNTQNENIVPIILGGLFVLILVVTLIAYSYSQNTAAVSSVQTQFNAIETQLMQQVQLSNLGLVQSADSPEFYTLTGEIKNDSTHTIDDVMVGVKAYDCPTDTIVEPLQLSLKDNGTRNPQTAGCTTIGEETDYLKVKRNVYGQISPVSPNEVLEASANLDFAGMPPIRGYFKWSYVVLFIDRDPADE